MIQQVVPRSESQEGRPCFDSENTYDQMKTVLEHGLFDICSKMKNLTQESLGFIYTPGVGEVCMQIKNHPELVDTLTARKRNVIVLTDGSYFGAESRQVLPILDWIIAQIKFYTGLDAYPLAVPSHENIENTLEDLSNVYGSVLILENVVPARVPKDMVVLPHPRVTELLKTDIFDAERSSYILNYLVNEQMFGLANDESIQRGHKQEPLTLTTHPYYPIRIHDKDYKTNSMKLHEFHRGKITIQLNFTNLPVLKRLFTPANLRKVIKEHHAPSKSGRLCIIVTDGTRILGLGDIGSKAGLPVMEGKSVLFKSLGNVDVMPICINHRVDVEEQIKAIKHYAANYTAVNLEDISAPNCFHIETSLRKMMNIPIFHDDQHGTAIIILAGLINASKVVRKELRKCKVVVNGAGAAGICFARLLTRYGCNELIMCDTHGAIYQGRLEDMNSVKEDIATITNKQKRTGKLEDVLPGADIFVGLSAAGALKAEWVKLMASLPIVFALANPNPEIDPPLAKEAGAAVVATGRSDFPNQINNSLVFPGIFRSIIDHKLKNVTGEMEVVAAEAIARSVKGELTDTNIVPLPLDQDVVITISQAIGNLVFTSKL